MVLYTLIGVNILKRKQAFKAISNDSFPLETVSRSDADLDDANTPSQDGESVFIFTWPLYCVLTLLDHHPVPQAAAQPIIFVIQTIRTHAADDFYRAPYGLGSANN